MNAWIIEKTKIFTGRFIKETGIVQGKRKEY